ncbi:MAG: LptF/LptG family permease [Proteobacteria bacterium]|nr:LptF/LptG family permease [Pseudomonadota bacterium]
MNDWTKIFHLYLVRHVGLHIIGACLVLVFLTGLIDFAEILNRASNRDSVSTMMAIAMGLFKLPSSLPVLIPFAVLFGALISFHKLNHHNEIIIARSGGFSMPRLVFGPIFLSFVIGVLMLIVVDPIASATSKRYTQMEEQNFGASSRSLTVSTEGIWLRDRNDWQNLIVTGATLNRSDDALIILGGEVFVFSPENTWLTRYTPTTLSFVDNAWLMEGGTMMRRDGKVLPFATTTIRSSLTSADLTDSKQKPTTIPFYKLWGYIQVLDQAGLSSLGHRSYLYYQASIPLVLIGMVLIAGYFALSYRGRQQRSRLVLIAIACGLGFYFVKDMMYVFGTSGRLPPWVAGLAPGMIITSIGLATLIRADNLS